MKNKCDVCGTEVEFGDGGGAALMMAFCVSHSTSLTNISFCKDCYQLLLKEPLKKLAENCCIELTFEEDENALQG